MSANPSNDNKPKDDLFNLAKANAKDTIAYILMVVGIILTLFQSFWGGFIVGLVLGYFYKSEIIQTVTNYTRIIDQEGLVKSVILGGTLLALFIGSYPLFIGVAIIVALYFVIGKDLTTKS
jgi:hypothetical protein